MPVMTIIVSDTKAQADYWCKQLSIRDAKRIVDVRDVLGIPRSTRVIAVGPLEWPATYRLLLDLKDHGFVPQFPRTN